MTSFRTLMVAISALAFSGCATRSARVHFVENDYVRALSDAKSRNVPLFVEMWAPW